MRRFVEAYLERASTTGVKAPVIVEVEADEAQDGKVEEYLPTRVQAAIAVQSRAPLYEKGLCRMDIGGDRRQPLGYLLEVIPLESLVGKERNDVESPGRRGHMFPRQSRSYLVIDKQNGQHFERRDAVKNGEEDQGEDIVEARTLRQSRSSLVGG